MLGLKLSEYETRRYPSTDPHTLTSKQQTGSTPLRPTQNYKYPQFHVPIASGSTSLSSVYLCNSIQTTMSCEEEGPHAAQKRLEISSCSSISFSARSQYRLCMRLRCDELSTVTRSQTKCNKAVLSPRTSFRLLATI
jgi:hypothetical protein